MMVRVVEEAMELYRDFPDIMAGFDLVRGNRSNKGMLLQFQITENIIPSGLKLCHGFCI